MTSHILFPALFVASFVWVLFHSAIPARKPVLIPVKRDTDPR